MAKTIKFNLMCDGYPCRNIEDVQEHFCIEDMLEYYENGLLKRWLEVRGFKDELAEVEDIKATEVLHITEDLIRIFEILTDEDKVKEAVSLINYQKKRQAANQVYEERGYQSATVISNYVSGYDSIIKEMMKKSTPSKVVQQHINTLATDYQPLFEKNIYPLFITSLQDRPLVCLNLLYNEHSRKFLVPKYSRHKDFYPENKTLYDPNRKSAFSAVQQNNVAGFIFDIITNNSYFDDKKFVYFESLFEGQLKVAEIDNHETKVLEKSGNRCLFVAITSLHNQKDINVEVNKNMVNLNEIEPLPIIDGLKIQANCDEYEEEDDDDDDYEYVEVDVDDDDDDDDNGTVCIAYFKVDD